MTAIGKALEPAFRSKLERDYAAHLSMLQAAGEIKAWWFERTTFRLGHDCRLTPDFQVQLPDHSIEYHETKGFQRDDAMAKLRIAAEQQPFVFRLVTRSKEGAWEIQEVGPRKGEPKSVAGPVERARVLRSRRSNSRPVEAAANRAPQDERKPKLNGKEISMEYVREKGWL